MRKFLAPLVIGLGGVAILITLGLWQVQRLGWKEALIAEFEAKRTASPGALPAVADEADAYLPVRVHGTFQPGEVHVLTSAKPGGPGFRIIAPFRSVDGRRVMVDRGYVPETQKTDNRPLNTVIVEGHLLWPKETDSFTPEADETKNMWFARDVALMADALEAEPLLVVASRPTGPGSPRPLPATANFANNHLQYAITWFSLAVVWAGMSLYWVLRLRRV